MFVGFLIFYIFFSRFPLQLWCFSQDMAWRFAEWERCDLAPLFLISIFSFILLDSSGMH
jgi:hypothetical protein